MSNDCSLVLILIIVLGYFSFLASIRSSSSTSFSTPLASLSTLRAKACSSLVNGEFMSVQLKLVDNIFRSSLAEPPAFSEVIVCSVLLHEVVDLFVKLLVNVSEFHVL